MRVNAWLESACDDADRRGLPELKPLLEALARSTRVLRDADKTVTAAEHRGAPAPEPGQ